MTDLVQINKKTKYNEIVDQNPFENTTKLLNHMDRLSAYFRGEDPFPINCEISPVLYCNQACAFCVSAYNHLGNPSMTKKEKESALKHLDSIGAISNDPERKKGLDGKYVKKFLKEAKELGLKSITLSGGGESTMWLDFSDVVKFAHDIGLEVALMTNGAWKEKDTEVIGNHMRWVRVSLDTFNEKLYRKEKNTGLFPKVIQNVKNILKYPVKIGLNCNVGDYNKDEILDFAFKSKELGVNYVQYRPILGLPWSVSFNEKYRKQYSKEWIEELKPKLSAAEQLSDEKFKVHISWDKFEGLTLENYGRIYTKCTYHNFQCILNADGNLMVCLYRTTEPDKFSFGNIYEKTAKEIWESEQRKKALDYCNNNLDLDKCQLFCKGHNINRFIHTISNPREESDVNFL